MKSYISMIVLVVLAIGLTSAWGGFVKGSAMVNTKGGNVSVNTSMHAQAGGVNGSANISERVSGEGIPQTRKNQIRPVIAPVKPILTRVPPERAARYRTLVSQFRQKMPKTVEAWKEARQRFLQKRAEMRTRIQSYIKEKAMLRKKMANATPEEKLNLSKEYIARGLNVAIGELQQISSFIQQNSHIDNETKAEILAKIQLHIENLEELNQSIHNATSIDEVRAGVQKIREGWKAAKEDAKEVAIYGQCTALKAVVNRAERAGQRLENATAKFEAKGFDMSKTREALQTFEAKIESAKALINDCNASAEQLREAKGDVISAYKELRQALSSLHAEVRAEAGAGAHMKAGKGMNGSKSSNLNKSNQASSQANGSNSS